MPRSVAESVSVFSRPVTVLMEYGNYLTEAPYLATTNVTAYNDNGSNAHSLTIGATSNVIFEAEDKFLMYSSNGFYLHDTNLSADGSFTRSNDMIFSLNRSADASKTMMDLGANHNVLVSFSNQINMNSTFINTTNGGYDRIQTSKSSLVIGNSTSFESNVAIMGNSVTYGAVFGQNFNLWSNKSTASSNVNEDLSKIGFGFRINSNDQLELIKMSYFNDSSVANKRVAVFGMTEVAHGASDSSSNYLVFDAMNTNSPVSTNSGGSLITSASPLDAYIHMTGSYVGIDTLSAEYKLDVNGTGRFADKLVAANGAELGADLSFSVDDATNLGSATKRIKNIYCRSNIILGDDEVYISADTGTFRVTDAAGVPLSSAAAGSTMTGVLNMTGNNINNINIMSASNITSSNATIGQLTTFAAVVTPGADYAEYVTKSNASEQFSVGELVGIDMNGQITSSYGSAVHFMVVSGAPSIIGGYTIAGSDLSEKEHDAFMISHEKIAFCGRVPVTCANATVGSYIVPVPSATGTIECDSIDSVNITLSQYMSSVGHVICMSNDVPIIIVKS